jgi:hypothetical protein
VALDAWDPALAVVRSCRWWRWSRRPIRHRWHRLTSTEAACRRPADPADLDDMGWLWNDTGKAEDMTPEDRRDFTRLDEAVSMAARAAKVIIEGGRALKAIRDRQLYRVAGVGTWDEYLGRHGLTRRRADQLVSAAGVLEAVAERVQAETGTAVPDLTERAVRPLVGLDPDQAVEVMVEAAGDPAGITPATIRKAAGRRRKAKAAKVPRPRRYRVPGAIVAVTFNRKGTGSAIDALTAALRQAEADLEAQAEAA